MKRQPPPRPVWQSIHIPFRLIDSVFGKDAIDDAGDRVAQALADLSDYPTQFPCRFSEDLNHPNPWYHGLVFSVLGMPAPTFRRLQERLAELGLLEDG